MTHCELAPVLKESGPLGKFYYLLLSLFLVLCDICTGSCPQRWLAGISDILLSLSAFGTNEFQNVHIAQLPLILTLHTIQPDRQTH